MKFRILGPLRVDVDDGRHPAFEPRQMKVLAVLLLSANEIVARQHLIDAVWDEDPPVTARRQLQNCISALRSRLGTAWIIADGPGYRIRVRDGQLDAQVFQDRVVQAQELISQGLIAQAVQRMRTALDLWRGPALAGSTGRVLDAAAARLNEERLAAMEQCLDLELRLGRHHGLVGELTELVASHPLRERLVGQLMLALQRSGRRSEALHAYQGLRCRLAEELGLDPSERLQELHDAILRNETAVLPALGPQPSGAPGGTLLKPRQLPACTPHFIGRVEELRQLTAAFDTAGHGGTAVVISAIDGTAGIGKTALAVQWAHQAADRFPDGQLYVNLRGFDPCGSPMPPVEAVRGFLDALGVAPQHIPISVDGHSALFRSLIADRKVLVVLDNARDAEQVRPLLPGSPGSVVVITSRNWLGGLVADGARPVTLDVLTDDEAVALLASHLGRDRVNVSPPEVVELISHCARLPLALSIMAAWATAHPRLPLGSLAAQLRDERTRLDTLNIDDPIRNVRAVFSWSYHALTPQAARLFRLLGLHPGPDVSEPAIAALAGLPTDLVRTPLTELTRAHLLDEHVAGRYRFHDLLRIYAAEQAAGHEPEHQRQAAIHRLLDFYLHTGAAAALLLDPHRDPITLPPPQPHVVPLALTDNDHAMDWLTSEHHVMIAASHAALTHGFDIHAWQLPWTLTTYLSRRGHWHDWAITQRTALTAAARTGDRTAQAFTHRSLARAHAQLGRYPEARTHLQHALTLYQELGDLNGQANVHDVIGWLHERQGQYGQALTHAQHALELFRSTDHARQADALNAVGWCHIRLGDYQEAIDHCQQALGLLRDLGDRDGQAHTLDSLASGYHHNGQYIQAITFYQQAFALFRDLGDRYYQATILSHLGDAHYAAGDHATAHTTWRQALTIFEEDNHPEAHAISDKLANPPNSG